MCFKNLPIEFDAQGNATLKPGVANPYSYVETPAPTPIEDDPERMRELFKRNRAVRRVDFDPATRVAATPCSAVGAPAPAPIEDAPEGMRELFKRNGAVRRVDFDPVTRVAGAL